MYEIDLNLPKQIVADVLSNHEIHSVAFVGCGASMSDLYPAKYFLANNTDKLNVQIFTANEFNYDTPSWVNEHTFESDLLEGQHFAGRESVESELTEVLHAALPGQVVTDITAEGGPGAAALERVREAGLRVQLARRFHNEAVKEVQRVRAKRVVRLFRLAGYADLPRTVEFDDTLPG